MPREQTCILGFQADNLSSGIHSCLEGIMHQLLFIYLDCKGKHVFKHTVMFSYLLDYKRPPMP